MSIEPGRYKAKIQDYGIRTVGEKKTPQMSIQFKTECDHTVFFQNFLTANTINSEYFSSLMDTLVATGALKTKKFTDISKGLEGGALNTDVELSIVVDTDMDQDGSPRLDKNGHPYMKVSFINNPSNGVKGALAESEAITVLAGLNLDAHILQARQRNGVADSAPALNGSDVPF